MTLAGKAPVLLSVCISIGELFYLCVWPQMPLFTQQSSVLWELAKGVQYSLWEYSTLCFWAGDLQRLPFMHSISK